MKARQLVAGAAAMVALGGGIQILRQATQSTHYQTGADTRLEILVTSRINAAEPTQTLDEISEAHLSSCRLEVTSDIESITAVPETEPRQYLVILRPALDSSDRKQFAGCVEDWNLDQNQMDVISMRDITVDPNGESSNSES